ncbi:unnamed protein product, partial [Heterosigma akashiwo]
NPADLQVGLWGGRPEALHQKSLGVLPHYIIIGAQKGGTSSLYDYLIDHPMVVPAHRKEIHFFDWMPSNQQQVVKHFQQTHKRRPTEVELVDTLLKVYESWFYMDKLTCQGCEQKITGEATPSYMFQFWMAIPQMQRILHHKPKLVIILRDPVTRAYSHFEMGWHHTADKDKPSDSINDAFAHEVKLELSRLRAANITPDSDPEEFATLYKPYSLKENCVGRGLYIFQLEAWSRHFDDIYVLETEDFIKHGVQETMQGVHNFLGLQNSTVRHPRVDKKGNYIEPLRPDTKALLCELYAPFNEKLEEFLGRRLQFHACND